MNKHSHVKSGNYNLKAITTKQNNPTKNGKKNLEYPEMIQKQPQRSVSQSHSDKPPRGQQDDYCFQKGKGVAGAVEKLGPCEPANGSLDGATAVENSIKIPQRLNIEQPHDPATSVLGTNPSELKPASQRGISHPFSSSQQPSGRSNQQMSR